MLLIILVPEKSNSAHTKHQPHSIWSSQEQHAKKHNSKIIIFIYIKFELCIEWVHLTIINTFKLKLNSEYVKNKKVKNYLLLYNITIISSMKINNHREM